MSKSEVRHITNAEYHGERDHLSSSNLKLLLKDPEQFYQEKILGNSVREEKSVFEEGSLVHSMILEPQKIDDEYAFFAGKVKRGAEFERFKEENPGKTLISQTQLERCAAHVNAYYKRPEAIHILKGGVPELSVFGDYKGVKLKARFDYINVDKGYIADIKTTGYPADQESFKQTIRDFSYDLSAALYLKIAERHWNKQFDFYFVVISKSDGVCEVFKLSDRARANGLKQIEEALRVYKQCKKSGLWQSPKKEESANYEILEV